MADINLGVGGANSASGGYEIDNSVKTEATNNEWFYRSSPTQGNRQTFTFSFWHKRTQITGYPADPYLMSQGSNARFHITGNANPTLRFMWDGNSTELESSPLIRDTAAWYHIVLAVDTTQATASNRVKLYVNGEQISWDNSEYPTQNSTSTWMSTTNMYFNTFNGDGSYDASGYYAEICVIDGQQLAPTSFGEFDSVSGIWKPIDVSGLTFGNEGFYLDFEDSSDLGADVSGNNNDCTLNNIAAADQATDTPTNNFCTMNINFKTNDNIVVSEGQTKVTCGSGTGWLSNVGTFALTKGKWYWELASVTSVYQMFGIADASDSIIPQAAGGYYLGYGSNDTTLSVGMYMINGSIYGNQDGGSGVGIAPGAVGDVYGVALDLDNLGFYIIRNGVSPSGSDPSSGSSLTGAVTWNDSIYSGYYYPAVSVFQGNGLEMNFGGYTSNPIASAASDANGYGNFEYAPPSGYYAICSKNLSEYG
jgi:hypothetical protein